MSNANRMKTKRFINHVPKALGSRYRTADGLQTSATAGSDTQSLFTNENTPFSLHIKTTRKKTQLQNISTLLSCKQVLNYFSEMLMNNSAAVNSSSTVFSSTVSRLSVQILQEFGVLELIELGPYECLRFVLFMFIG